MFTVVNKKISNRKGITLVELIVAIALMGFVGMLAIQAISTTGRITFESSREMVLQDGFRQMSETIKNVVRDASGVFIMPADSFNSAKVESGSYLTKTWDYIGILDKMVDGVKSSELVYFKYDASIAPDGGHVKTVLTPAIKGYIYELEFYKGTKEDPDATLEANDKTIGFLLLAKKYDEDGVLVDHMDISSEMEAINSIQVVDWGSTSAVNPGRAIAFRKEKRDTGEEIPASVEGTTRVALVLDLSQSMTASDITSTPSVKIKRIDALVDATINQLIETFKDNPNVEIAIIPYAYNANFGYHAYGSHNTLKPRHTLPGFRELYDVPPAADLGKLDYTFLKVTEKYQEMLNYLNLLRGESKGHTNTSDGIRRAHWALSKAADKDRPGKKVKEYIFLITDGDFTHGSLIYGEDSGNLAGGYAANPSFLVGPGDVVRGSTITFVPPNYETYRYDSDWKRLVAQDKAHAHVYYQASFEADSTTPHMRHFNELKEMIAARSSSDTQNFIVGLGNSISVQTFKTLEGVLDTVSIRAVDMESLNLAFEGIGKKILEDTWHIDGPQY